MIVSPFVRSKKFAGALACALAATLAACGGSSPGNTAQNAPAAAQNPPPAPPPPASMLVAELTAPANSSASSVASPSGEPAPAAGSAEYAQVVSLTPLSGMQQVCSDQSVTERRPQSDDHQVAGTVIGAIAGGVIGNQIGSGGGRRFTTVAGAIGGGIAGKKIQEAHQEGDTVTRVVRRCRNVVAGKDVPQLFDVVYAYQGQNLRVKLDYDPGSRIALPVRGVQ
ncbi:MAG: glycine zipper 2TM domain-containing protein [Rudaea sp.]|uniref:glycine zipper 2TM domain-containing protein n=1 Tax=Rudaea sp. TaxID=2136325 RepID=UPI0039E43D54